MERTGARRRDIHFRSDKNDKTLCVHTESARTYARLLEQDESVSSYEVGVALDVGKFQFVSRIDIRKEYFTGEWASDFVIRYADGSVGVREIVAEEMLSKRSVIEKLELSRRYWSISKADSWKIVLIERGE